MVEERLRRICYDVFIAHYLRSWYDREEFILGAYSLDILSQDAGVALHRMEGYFLRKIITHHERWMHSIRVFRAIELIHEHPAISSEKLAYAVGFGDKRSFLRQFEKVTGASITEYRNSLHLCRLDIYFRVSR
ncbi:MAG: helix-turn-helix domain-containing protein [Bacteroidales bacterium]|nr:helix-turn-helix domain-containing protein [Bacteroidales bacterium]